MKVAILLLSYLVAAKATADIPSVTLATLSPSAAPTSSTDSPTITCLNDPDFIYNGDPKKTCQWIRTKESRRVQICSQSYEAHIACPQSCGLCCADDPYYTFETDWLGDTVDCDWLSKKEVRQEKYCETWNSGTMVQNACPSTCGLCQDYVSVAPSATP